MRNSQPNLLDEIESLSDLGRLELLWLACRLWFTHRRARPQPPPVTSPARPRLPRFWILIEPDLFDRRQRHYVGEPYQRRFTDQVNWCYL